MSTHELWQGILQDAGKGSPSSKNVKAADVSGLRLLLEGEIERRGTTESFMIRAGLLRDMLDELEWHRERLARMKIARALKDGLA